MQYYVAYNEVYNETGFCDSAKFDFAPYWNAKGVIGSLTAGDCPHSANEACNLAFLHLGLLIGYP
jgi:hypothetical protein